MLLLVLPFCGSANWINVQCLVMWLSNHLRLQIQQLGEKVTDRWKNIYMSNVRYPTNHFNLRTKNFEIRQIYISYSSNENNRTTKTEEREREKKSERHRQKNILFMRVRCQCFRDKYEWRFVHRWNHLLTKNKFFSLGIYRFLINFFFFQFMLEHDRNWWQSIFCKCRILTSHLSRNGVTES